MRSIVSILMFPFWCVTWCIGIIVGIIWRGFQKGFAGW